MKNVVVAIVAIVAAAGGYYVGYDVGYERGENHAHVDTADTIEEANIPEHGDDARLTAAWTMLIGEWSSQDDRNFIREYKDDGTVVDSYASASGETHTDAEWSLFTANMNEDVPFQMNNTDVYIKQTEADGANMYFRIESVTPDALELVYMDRGGMLRFGKMTTGHELQDGIED